jgi:hypothetical protein
MTDMFDPTNPQVALLAELAKECDNNDPIDWSGLNITQEQAFHLMAGHVAEMEDNVLTLKAVCVKLMVENFALNLKLMGTK